MHQMGGTQDEVRGGLGGVCDPMTLALMRACIFPTCLGRVQYDGAPVL